MHGLFGTPHGHGAFGSDLACHVHDRIEQGLVVRVDLVHETSGLGFLGAPTAPGIGQFPHDALGNELGHALQGAHVGGHANVDLMDAEPGVLGGVPHVGGRHHVDAAADTRALDRRQHRHTSPFQGGEGVLQFQRGAAKTFISSAAVALGLRPVTCSADGFPTDGFTVAKDLEVHARAEVPAFGREHHGPHVAAIGEFIDDCRKFGPERRDHRVAAFGADHRDHPNLVDYLYSETLVCLVSHVTRICETRSHVPARGKAMGALDGVRVLDAGLLIQGPQAAQTLADMGADVIKVELPGMGDQGRWIPIGPQDERAPYFIGNNRGKRSVTMDLRIPEGAEVFLKLVETADVVISNFKAGTLDEWGVGYEDAVKRNPRIIYGMGTTFGPAGPAAAREGADLAGQAAGGLISTTGTDETGPTPVGATIADHIGCQNMAIGVLGALMARERTGRGQRVDVSLVGSQLYAQCAEYTAFFLSGVQQRPSNYGHPLLHSFYGILETFDGWIALVGVTPDKREAFGAVVGMPGLTDDPRFQPRVLTGPDRKALFEILAPTFRTKSSQEWGVILESIGCRWAPVNDYEAAAADEHNWINGYLQEVEHPEWGTVRMVGSPIQMSDTPVVPGKFAPELGADTELMLVELGYDWDQISAMRESGAI